jgi:peptide/nickel transport system substrate-binding protein
MSTLRLLAVVVSVLALLSGAAAPPAEAQSALRVVMHSDLKIVDPIWTTAYIVRNHGYLVYDTLFAMDAKARSSRRWSTSTRSAPTSAPTP